MRRIRLLAGWAGLVAAAAACDRPQAAAPPGDAPGDLEGRWTLELRLEHPAQLRVDTAAMKPLRGEVALLRSSPPRRPRETTDLPAYHGTHTVDARPFGIVLRRRGSVPTVSARPAGGDSVVITLDPDAPGGRLTAAGRLAGDSVAGRWWWHGPGRSTGASGRFTLRRN
jgi:hypothetical protein